MRVDPSLPQVDLMPPLDDASIELGAIYQSSAVCSDGPPEHQLDDPRSGNWTVGARVPHILLSHNGRETSTLDVADVKFALLVSDRPELWSRAAAEVERSLGVSIAVQAITSDDVKPSDKPPAEESASGWKGAALVRPDGVLAWKPRTSADEAVLQLPGVMSKLLGHPEGAG